MSIKKLYNPEKAECKVTFRIDKEISKSITKANLTGDFNNWDIESTPMKRSKTGEFSITVTLQKGKEYQFKYLLDCREWINEKEADKFIPNEFQSENSVVAI